MWLASPFALRAHQTESVQEKAQLIPNFVQMEQFWSKKFAIRVPLVTSALITKLFRAYRVVIVQWDRLIQLHVQLDFMELPSEQL